MMCGKNLALWYCILPLVASSSVFWTNLTSDNEEKDSTVRYHVDANTMVTKKRNYKDKGDWYNLHENFTKNNDNTQHTYRVNFTNNHEHNDSIQYKSGAHAAKNHENDDQILDNIVPKICDNITCIRLCCPFGNYLVNGKCIAKKDKSIFLRNINGYVDKSLNNKSKGVGGSFLLIVHDPCPKTRHYLLNPYYNMFLANGALYLPYYNTIIESTSYCFATVDHNIFAVNVCLESMKKIMNKTINYNKDAIYPINLRMKSAEINITNTIDKSRSTLLEYLKNSNTDNNKNNISPYNMCDNITCIRLCCPFGNILINGTCIAVQGNFIFLQNLYGYINNSLQNESERRKELFLLIVHNPCQNDYWLYPYFNTIFANGSFYIPKYNRIIESTSYCLANMDGTRFIVNICKKTMGKINDKVTHKSTETNIITFIHNTLNVARILLSLMMFVVYSIVPELRNIHGFILRRYSGLVFIGETVRLTDMLIIKDMEEDIICIASAFIKYYTFLASYFWLNVMCFDIWYTFRQLRSLQRNVKQQKRKKLIIYSVFAWGGPFILTIICSVIEFVPGFVSNNFRPNFRNECWFNAVENRKAYFLYYNDVGTISRIVTICLCICTAQKIAIYEKDIAFRLKDSKGQRYNHNKQWFKLYLEAIKILFISYCIQWYIYIIQLCYEEDPFTVQYIYFALDSIQHFCIFIIFVWKKKIRKLVLKRLGYQSRDMFSTERAIVFSNTSTTSGMSSLCENTNPYANKQCHANSSFDSTDL